MNRRVLVCGGGLAGIAAACEASLRGAEVTLVERRPFLGGKAYSFAVGDREIDNGQHVYLGCCTAYRWLLRLLGTASLTTLQPTLRAPVRDRAGRTGVLTASALPAPLHIGPSFVRYPHVSPLDRVRALRALSALMTMSERERRDLDGFSFATWLDAHGQRPDAIARFWDLIVLPTCNDRSDRVSAAIAAYVFREGLFRTRAGSAIGYARVGLGHLVRPAAAFLTRRGGRVLLDRGVVSAAGGSAELSDGTRVEADAVILALPPERAHGVAPHAIANAPHVGESPIVNVHIWLDRPVMTEHFEAIVDSPAQWVFNRTAIEGRGSGQHLAVSVSGARAEIDMDRDALAAAFVAELRALYPAMRAARVERVHVVKEPAATFAAEPGQALRRPGGRTHDPSILLAGAWTDTGWPATMEGAVRSGIRAARMALGG